MGDGVGPEVDQGVPCAPGQPRTVEHPLRVPTAYREGRHHLTTLPRVGTETLAATVVVSAARPGGRPFLDGKPISSEPQRDARVVGVEAERSTDQLIRKELMLEMAAVSSLHGERVRGVAALR
ncbi:hypothetical protein WMF18_09845 [Sorangium sp. So ce315]|uniref:hypothetical protein n=1 Tax=Sorangium sp. So ce315 TaxID=3133299 RepID=UPI003F5EF732